MVNKTILIGRVGQDPESKTLDSGDMVVNFSLATSEKYKNKSGEKKETTEWHRIVAWRKLAEIIDKYVKKGDLLYVEGKIKYEKYEKNGVEMTATKIEIFEMKMLGGNKAEPQQTAPVQNVTEPQPDDLPF